MSKITFEEDPSSRKLTRFLFFLQIAGMGIVLGLSFLHLFFLALAVSFLTLILFVTILLWLYARYWDLPFLHEKRDLEHLLLKFQKGAQKEGGLIQVTGKERQRLTQAEKEEINLALKTLQKNHMENGLATASIEEAEIPGLDPGLKKVLVGFGILSAAQVTEGITEVPGIDEAKRQAMIDWRNSIIQGLDNNKPVHLTDGQLDGIQAKYQALHAMNDALHRKAQASKQLLEHELTSFQARLRELAPLTFVRYLSTALASQGAVAALIAFALIAMQVVSSVIATRSAMTASALGMDSLPTAAPSPAIKPSAAETLPPTFPPVITDTPTVLIIPSTALTLTSSVTASPVWTITAQTIEPHATLPTGMATCIPQNTLRETGLVVTIIDGDTIDVRIQDHDVRVRYIGIDTPEQNEAFYQEATAYNQKLVGNKMVTLVKDTSETDRFNRLLRYVSVEDTFVNNELVALGYARASAYAPDTACVSAFETAQREAQLVKLGLWMPTPEMNVPPITGGGGTVTCDPSYPGVCIPPAPPDLDCGDVSYQRFQVLPPDPHGFDRDGDGVGCEG